MSETAEQRHQRLVRWIEADQFRMHALHCVQGLGLPDWCIAAGFVRNLVWDHLHGYQASTPLNDIDVIYHDPRALTVDRDAGYQGQLQAIAPYPWSVKNQARMHRRNGDRPYRDTAHAMSQWVEVETAIGVTLDGDALRLVAPFGLGPLFRGTLTINPRRKKPVHFQRRLREKGWLQRWPGLQVVD